MKLVIFVYNKEPRKIMKFEKELKELISCIMLFVSDIPLGKVQSCQAI